MVGRRQSSVIDQWLNPECGTFYRKTTSFCNNDMKGSGPLCIKRDWRDIINKCTCDTFMQCYGLFVSPTPNLYVEVLIPSVRVAEGGLFQMKSQRGGSPKMELVPL